MIEETARVVSVENDGIYVETMRKSTCSGCRMSRGCGNALLDNLFAGKRQMVRVLPVDGIEKGDEVVVGLDESALLKGSFLVYSVPLLLMIAFTVLLNLLVPSVADGWSILAGVSGLFAGLFWLRRYSMSIHNDGRYQPVILRKSYSRS